MRAPAEWKFFKDTQILSVLGWLVSLTEGGNKFATYSSGKGHHLRGLLAVSIVQMESPRNAFELEYS